jgi:hypothetical protein
MLVIESEHLSKTLAYLNLHRVPFVLWKTWHIWLLHFKMRLVNPQPRWPLSHAEKYEHLMGLQRNEIVFFFVSLRLKYLAWLILPLLQRIHNAPDILHISKHRAHLMLDILGPHIQNRELSGPIVLPRFLVVLMHAPALQGENPKLLWLEIILTKNLLELLHKIVVLWV